MTENRKLKILWHSVAGYVRCYDDQTEVLTKDGWKYFKDVIPEDQILTYNQSNSSLEYQFPKNRTVVNHKGPMYSARNKHFSLLVTLNHEMLVLKRQRNNKWKERKVLAKNILHKTVKMLKTGKWNATNNIKSIYIGKKQISLVDFATFMGHYLSEGYVDHNPINGNYTVALCQNLNNIEPFKKSMETVTDNKISIINDRKVMVRDKALWEYLIGFGYAHEKYVPEIIKQSDVEILKLFLSAYIKGDGTLRSIINYNAYISTSSVRMRDDLQEIGIKAGYCSDYAIYSLKGKKGSFGKSNYTNWRINITRGIPRTLNSMRDKQSDQIVDYDGVIYCLEVPNHNMVIRRDGKSLICGNSGYGVTTRNITSRLVKRGYNVIVSAYYGLEPGGTLKILGVPHLPSKMGKFGSVSCQMHAKSFHPDIAILNTDWWAFPWFPKMPCVSILHSPMDHSDYPEELINLTKSYDYVCAYCHWQQEELLKNGIKSYFTPHGINTKEYFPRKTLEARKVTKFNKDKFIIGRVSANSDKEDRKSWAKCFIALRLFFEDNPDTRKNVLMYCHANPHDKRGLPLDKFVHKQKLDDIVKFTDPKLAHVRLSTEEMNYLYNSFDILMNPSKREGFCLPIIEALACGKPVIATDFSSMTELVKGRGWLVENALKGENIITTPINACTAIPDVYGIRDAIKDAYFHPKKIIKFKRPCREFALDFDWDRIIEKQWIPLLEEIPELEIEKRDKKDKEIKQQFRSIYKKLKGKKK